MIPCTQNTVLSHHVSTYMESYNFLSHFLTFLKIKSYRAIEWLGRNKSSIYSWYIHSNDERIKVLSVLVILNDFVNTESILFKFY